MKKTVIIFIAGLCFGQVNWTYETVDSVMEATYDFYFNSLALDSAGIPHIVYNKGEFNTVIYASRLDSCTWQNEIIDSGLFYYGFSLIFDANNTPHISYYRKNSALNKTYICYAQCRDTGWRIEVVDSIVGYLGNYFWDFNSSIDLDTSCLPGIAYIAWNVEDSLHYIKYAHYNGTQWDTTIVARDTTWHHRYPLDWSPSLKLDNGNTPRIAFYRVRSDTHGDTIMIGYFDNTLNTWIISPAVCDPYGGYPISLALNSEDHPCIAHGWSVAVAYSWWDGLAWHTEYTGTTMGWVGVKIVLDLDSSDNPHILFRMDFGPVGYCYKKNGVWHISDYVSYGSEGHISLALDSSNEPHACFSTIENRNDITVIKYTKGTFVGIVETRGEISERVCTFQIYPNPAYDKICLILPYQDMQLEIFDITGRQIWIDIIKEYHYTWNCRSKQNNKVAPGVYFVRLETPDFVETEKVVFLK